MSPGTLAHIGKLNADIGLVIRGVVIGKGAVALGNPRPSPARSIIEVPHRLSRGLVDRTNARRDVRVAGTATTG
jgi:hypothetical protein